MPFGGVGFPPPKSSGGKQFIKSKSKPFGGASKAPGGAKKAGKPFGKASSLSKGR